MSEEKLIAQVRAIPGLEHVTSMHTLENGIDFEKWSELQTKCLLDVLLDCFFNQDFQDPYEQNALQRLINFLLMRNDYRLSQTNLKQIFLCLENSDDPLKINPALNMLSLTYDPAYIPVLEKYVASNNQALASTALEGIETIRKNPRH